MSTASLHVNQIQKDQAVAQLLQPLDHFLKDPKITEISICRPCEVWTKSFEGWQIHSAPELTSSFLQTLITAIIVYNGMAPKSINYVLLPGGQRGTIIQTPAVIDGSLSFMIRKHSLTVKTLEELNEEGAFNDFTDVSFNKPSEKEANNFLSKQDFTRLEPFEIELLQFKRDRKILEFLEKCVLHKRNIIIAGKTGSGKTTFARSLIEKVPVEERIITIEDVHELFLPNHPNHVHMLYGDNVGRVSADECLDACMRQSPDRIFLAELRGNEAWEYLNSLNTGHPGSITTTHANNALQTFERCATLIKRSEVGRQLDLEMIKMVLYTTVDVVFFVKNRKLSEVFYDPIFSKSKMA
ncbi:P-type DNA transfer ATPase VirB11 [Candidatus Bartonella washoeensis]|uniref:Type IV secretion system protein n=1 Tax=Cardidatus Bartonella washoeensis 085-0475 TaxID=1094564 RepID=J1JLV0_9HYPH|nr:P-type DNA transfer ATPase VirB11 [Bartonella washoeensis]EJF85250.1 P-type DNA transfer ATPase VirB11 [Bartonella washoeensis 085-0475]